MSIKARYLALNEKINRLFRFFWFKRNYRQRYRSLKKNNIQRKKLSKNQKNEIKKVWGKLCMNDYSTHELIYSITGNFNPNYCSALTFGTALEFELNSTRYKEAWSDKNFFDLHFSDVRFPNTLAHNIQGVFYDREYNKIEKDDVLSILSWYSTVVIKPSLDSGNGHGVKLVSVGDNISSVLESYKCDFIIQEVLEQYEPIKAFNPTSVNIIRLNSLFLDGKWSYLSASLRVGAAGSFTDNKVTTDGKGMTVIGIEEDGSLKEHAYYSCGIRIDKLPNGLDFKGFKLPNFEKAKEIAKSIHQRMPFARYVGFDIAFDKEGMPVVIEYNINAPGVFYYQLANGPLFEEKTKDVIDFINKNKLS